MKFIANFAYNQRKFAEKFKMINFDEYIPSEIEKLSVESFARLDQKRRNNLKILKKILGFFDKHSFENSPFS